MENIIYRVVMNNGSDLELSIIHTNEVEPYRPIRELGIQIIVESKQLDAALEMEELKSLIKYLNSCKDYIEEFNNRITLKKD